MHMTEFAIEDGFAASNGDGTYFEEWKPGEEF